MGVGDELLCEKQHGIGLRKIIGVINPDDIVPALEQSPVQRRGFSPGGEFFRHVEKAHARVAEGDDLDLLRRVVCAAVVDYQDFQEILRVVQPQKRLQRVRDDNPFVVSRNHQRDSRQRDSISFQGEPLPLGTESIQVAQQEKDELIGQHEPDDDDAEDE